MAKAKKKWFKSKAIWGGVIAILIGLEKLIEQNLGINLVSDQIIGWITTLAGALGVYGRKKATTEIE